MEWHKDSGRRGALGTAAVTPFGTTPDGRDVHAITIASETLQATILTWGAVLQDVRLAGVPYGLTLNSADLSDYMGAMHHYGGLMGPVVNRLTNARAVIDGKTHRFEPNYQDRHTLHSGAAGTQLKVWEIDEIYQNSCKLSVKLPDGEGGFPGNRVAHVHYHLSGTTLSMTVTATTDKQTLINFANHSYWNLDGRDTWAGHRLWIAADRYTPTDDANFPTGEVRDVAGTPYDFRTEREIHPQHPDFDTNFCLSNAPTTPRDVLTLTGQSGVAMTIATNQPGIQVFDAATTNRPNRSPYEGLAFEAQNWPDAPNKPGFPSIGLRPAQTYEQITSWRFSAP